MWYLVYVFDPSGNSWYEMMSDTTIDASFEERNGHYQAHNQQVRMKIVGKSSNWATVANKLKEKRDETRE